jgi:hypothetical protein|tara:strand:+ start:55 stop:333 length:279 start_codon:yes stop_codon:yes gene_type:complete
MKTITITKEEIKTGKDAIKWHLKNYGHITSLEAIREYGVTRLASIIWYLKEDGYTIHTEDLKKTTRFNRTTTIAKYLYMKPTPIYEQKIIWG